MKKNTVCLVMICKDEEGFIGKAIQSVKGYVDYYVIVDGHSTDGTIKEIKGYAMGDTHDATLLGEVHQFNEPFHAGRKRTYALELAKGKADYLLMMDADNTLEFTVQTEGFTHIPFEDLTADAYLVTKQCGEIHYPVLSLLKGDIDWQFTGILHEYPERKDGQPFSQELLPDVIIHEPVKSEGPRARSGTHYYDHALQLERELLDHPGVERHLHDRYVFYSAQSWRDAGMLDRAVEVYRVRARRAGWEEEVWASLYNIAQILQRQGKPVNEVLRAASEAWNYRPQRRESAYLLMELLRNNGMPYLAYTVGARTRALSCEKDLLFREVTTENKLFPELLQLLEDQMQPEFKSMEALLWLKYPETYAERYRYPEDYQRKA